MPVVGRGHEPVGAAIALDEGRQLIVGVAGNEEAIVLEERRLKTSSALVRAAREDADFLEGIGHPRCARLDESPAETRKHLRNPVIGERNESRDGRQVQEGDGLPDI